MSPTGTLRRGPQQTIEVPKNNWFKNINIINYWLTFYIKMYYYDNKYIIHVEGVLFIVYF